MVDKVLQVFYKEIKGLHQAAYVIAFFTFGSQILALVRDRLLAHVFGAGVELDVYYAAFKIPDFLFVLFASTLSVYVLIPFVSRHKEANRLDKAKHLLGQVFTIFLVGYTALAALIFILAPLLVNLLFPGLVEQSEQLVTILRILLLQPMLLGVSSLFGVVTQLSHRFVLYALSPLIYNLGIIMGLVAIYPFLGLPGLALGVVFGALGHLLVQYPYVRNSGLAFSITKEFDWQNLKSILAISIPRALTLSFNQLTLLVLVRFASLMAVGSVAVFQFAYNIQSVPLAIIGASYSVAAFPTLTAMAAKHDWQKFNDHVLVALRHIIFWSLPAFGLILVLRAHLVRVLLGSGAFDWSDTRLTAAVLAILALSLVAQATILLVVRAFYAAGKTLIPFLASLLGFLLAASSSYLLLKWYTSSVNIANTLSSWLRLEGIAGSEVLVLGIGYSAALIIQSLLLLFMLKIVLKLSFKGLGVHFCRALVASVAGILAAYGALNLFVYGIDQATFIGILLQGFLAGVVGIIAIILTYHFLRTPELNEIYRAFHKRLFKTDVIKPQADIL